MVLHTASLSHNTLVGPSIGTPNIHNLYHKASIISTAFFIAVNSDPKVDASNEFCLLLNHIAGALLQNKGYQFVIVLSPCPWHALHQRNNASTCSCLGLPVCSLGSLHWRPYFLPITPLKSIFINRRVGRVEGYLPLRMRLQVSEDMKRLLEMPHSGHRKVAWVGGG